MKKTKLYYDIIHNFFQSVNFLVYYEHLVFSILYDMVDEMLIEKWESYELQSVGQSLVYLSPVFPWRYRVHTNYIISTRMAIQLDLISDETSCTTIV